MSNTNKPLEAKEWLKAQNPDSNTIHMNLETFEAYAAYVRSFVPDDVEQAIVSQFQPKPSRNHTDVSYLDKREGARFGYSLASLASPDKEAVRFYEWVEQNRYEIDNREQHTHTIDQLYTIFKTSKQIRWHS